MLPFRKTELSQHRQYAALSECRFLRFGLISLLFKQKDDGLAPHSGRFESLEKTRAQRSEGKRKVISTVRIIMPQPAFHCGLIAFRRLRDLCAGTERAYPHIRMCASARFAGLLSFRRAEDHEELRSGITCPIDLPRHQLVLAAGRGPTGRKTRVMVNQPTIPETDEFYDWVDKQSENETNDIHSDSFNRPLQSA